MQQHQYVEARQILAEVEQWPPSLRTDKSRLMQRELATNIDVAEDQKLYQEAKDYRSVETLQSYINAAPIGTMKQAVQDYLNWLALQDGTMNLKLSLATVNWGDAVGNEDGIQLTVEKDGTKIFDLTDLESKGNTRMPFQNQSHSFKAKLSDQITLRATLKETDLWTTEMGYGERKVRVKELDGFHLPIRNDEMSNTIYFGLSGMPKTPELPIWKNKN
jgi:hypothetical protein